MHHPRFDAIFLDGANAGESVTDGRAVEGEKGRRREGDGLDEETGGNRKWERERRRGGEGQNEKS